MRLISRMEALTAATESFEQTLKVTKASYQRLNDEYDKLIAVFESRCELYKELRAEVAVLNKCITYGISNQNTE
jgi:hypothetical protein